MHKIAAVPQNLTGKIQILPFNAYLISNYSWVYIYIHL